MLTSLFARLPWGGWPTTLVGAAVMVSVLASATADAADFSGTSCVGSWSSFNCASIEGPAGNAYVRVVPPPIAEADPAHAAERDRAWLARCRPIIVRDRYGVARYQYAAPGCEFGRSED